MLHTIVVIAAFVALTLFLLPADRSEPTIIRIHDCPTATQYGDEVDADFWC